MTTNQIAYFSAKEQERHNKIMERETGRHNLADESIRTQSNLITESHYSRMDSETLRHNLATEEQARAQLNLGYAQLDLGNRQLQESTRHNMASESLQLQSLQETQRHDINTEKISMINANEAIRHNEAQETLTEKVNGSTIAANYAKMNESSSRAKLFQSQTEESKAKAELTRQQSELYKSQAYVQMGTELFNSTGNMIRMAAPLAR